VKSFDLSPNLSQYIHKKMPFLQVDHSLVAALTVPNSNHKSSMTDLVSPTNWNNNHDKYNN
jgi:hypothetical protein